MQSIRVLLEIFFLCIANVRNHARRGIQFCLGYVAVDQTCIKRLDRSFFVCNAGEKDALNVDVTVGTILETTIGTAILATKVAGEDSEKDD